MEKLLVSACLMGLYCRYDGKSNYLESIKALQKRYILLYICPECEGGLSTPRLPSEIKDGKVINSNNFDNTEYFIKGAKHALEIAKKYGIKKALWKAKSPSCGKGKVYDGTFTHTLVDGNGITASLLLENGIEVFTEDELERLIYEE